MKQYNNKLLKIEQKLKDTPTDFYSFYERFKADKNSIKEIAKELEISERAAEYACITGLKHGKPKDKKYPFAEWETTEIKELLSLADEAQLLIL